ncbi:alpha/beta fold hydrolase [Corynebacterium variabile]|uniref:alpha/beta fold hydrolase n=1 Tax=Corynebacterium variabile TaxID=1727 RepID=UPI0037360C7A
MPPRTSLRILLTVSLSTALVVPVGTAGADPTGEGPALNWGPCPVGSGAEAPTECAEIEVPRDYSDPDGATISLTMSRVPATGERKGTIAGNPGGPGGDALGMFATTDAGTPEAEGRITMPADVREHYDLLAVEPRGLAWGTPLDCPAPESLFGTAGDILAACESTDPGYASTITTDNTARDLEEARKALGEDRLNLYGVSYGGPLMATYATLFPENTDRVLLDSSGSPDQRWFGLGAARKQARIDGLNAMFAWLAERDDEYHLGTTPLQVYQRWAKVTAGPYGVQMPVTPPSAQDDDLSAGSSVLPGELGAQLTDTLVRTQWRAGTLADTTRMMLGDGDAYIGVMSSFSGIAQGLYDQSLWPVIGEQLRDPDAAAAETEAELSDMEEPSEEQAAASDKLEAQLRTVERAVICNENTVAPDTSLILPTLETRFTGGDLLRYNEDNIASGMFCAGWDATTTPTEISGKALDRAPLNIGYTKDTAVTADGATGMHRAMGGELVTVDGYSHGVLLVEPEKLADKVSDYFA